MGRDYVLKRPENEIVKTDQVTISDYRVYRCRRCGLMAPTEKMIADHNCQENPDDPPPSGQEPPSKRDIDHLWGALRHWMARVDALEQWNRYHFGLEVSPCIKKGNEDDPNRFDVFEALDCIQAEAEYIQKNAVESGSSGTVEILARVEQLRAYITGRES